MLWRQATRKKGAAFLVALQRARTCSIHALPKNLSEAQGYYRFLDNARVTEQEIMQIIQSKTMISVAEKRVLAIADSTEINCEGHINRIQNKQGLGMLSNNKTHGFHLHAILSVNEDDGFPLGIAGARLWSRIGPSISHSRKRRMITEKEVDKWYSDNLEARDHVLRQATHITYVMDRDADIYDVLDAVPNERTDVVIRCRHDRWINVGQTNKKVKKVKLHQFLSKQPSQGEILFKSESRQRRGQIICAEVKFASVHIVRPAGPIMPNSKEHVHLYIVEVKEIKSQRNTTPILWRIFTSKPVTTFQQAIDVVEIYRKRWQIEEFFRLIKTESFNLEASELEKGLNLRKLCLFVMEAAVKVAQLKAVRSEQSPIKIATVFSQQEIACLHLLNNKYRGTTLKQSNPFHPDSLSWASWIIARLGGWKGYSSQSPPGSITFKRGIERFNDIFIGFVITHGRSHNYV